MGTFLREHKKFWILLTLFAALPSIRIGTYHLFLFNLSHHRFEIAGFAFEADTDALIGIAVLFGLGLAFAAALTLSRFYCGTLCPNTLFAHFLRTFGSKKSPILRKIAVFLLMAFASFLLAFSLVSYGIDTVELVASLRSLSFAGALVLFLSLLMLIEIYLVQGWYCAYLCPYGAISAILPVEERLTYRFDDPTGACTGCEGCVSACPIPSLDIREGFDPRCIQCGGCEQACRKTFARNPAIETLITCETRPLLLAAGQRYGYRIAAALLLTASILGTYALLQEDHLDSCRLENRALY